MGRRRIGNSFRKKLQLLAIATHEVALNPQMKPGADCNAVLLLGAGPGGVGDGWVPARASLRGHPKHRHAWELRGLLPAPLQLLRRGPLSGVQEHGHCATGQGREPGGPEVDPGPSGTLCLGPALLLQRHLCRGLERILRQKDD